MVQVARVLGIFLMMYAHDGTAFRAAMAWAAEQGSGPAAELLAKLPRLLYHVASRAAVPLLAFISGWLLAATFRGGFWSTARRKTQTLLLPMLIWTAISLCFFLALEWLVDIPWIPPSTPGGWIDELFGFTQWPMNAPLYFLRDLFVASLLGAAVLSRSPAPGTLWAVTLVILLMVLFVPPEPLLRRPLILLMLMLGVASQRTWGRITLRATWIGAAAGAVLLYLHMYFPLPHERIDEVQFRLASAGLAWGAAVLAARLPLAGPFMVRIAPAMFLVFCTHELLFEVLGLLVRALAPQDQGGVTWLLYTTEPLVGLVVGVYLFTKLGRHAPHLLDMLTGNRGRANAALPQPAAAG